MTPPMMKCGHAANGVETTADGGRPCCVICDPPNSVTVDDSPPDLVARTARCSHYGQVASRRKCESNYGTQPGQVCQAERPSSTGLPFFHHTPQQPHDRFYCGCCGWD